MPYTAFFDLVGQCILSDVFIQWTQSIHNKYNKQPTIPIELLVLCVLRYLSRGWTLDNLQEPTAINKETVRIFIHKFIHFRGTVLYTKYVIAPCSQDDLHDWELELLSALFLECIGSTNATHVIMEVCSYRLRQLHSGYKLAHTARTYHVTTNNRHRILSTTHGHPAWFNDKTLDLFDDFINQLELDNLDCDFIFTHFDFDADGKVIEI